MHAAKVYFPECPGDLDFLNVSNQKPAHLQQPSASRYHTHKVLALILSPQDLCLSLIAIPNHPLLEIAASQELNRGVAGARHEVFLYRTYILEYDHVRNRHETHFKKIGHTSNLSPGPLITPAGSTSLQQLAVVELSFGHVRVPLSIASISSLERPSSLLRGDWHSQCLVIMSACAGLFSLCPSQRV